MMKQHSLKNILFLGGMSTILFVGIVVGSYATISLKQKMIEQRYNELEIGLDFKKKQLENYIKLITNNLSLLGKNNEVREFTTQLEQIDTKTSTNAYQNNYSKDVALMNRFKKHDQYFKEFIDNFGFYDLFLIDRDHGHILYSVKKESDLGESLKYSNLKQTKLAEAYRATVDTKLPYVSDFGLYEPSANQAAMFITVPILDDQNNLLGVLGIQIGNQMITDFVKVVGTEVVTKETYLVGRDHLPRSETLFRNTHNLVEKAFKNPTQYILDTDGVKFALDGQKGRYIYKDYKLHSVIAVTDIVDLKTIQWGIVSKINEEEIYAPIYNQIYRIIGLILFSMILATFLLQMVVRKIISNISQIASNANRLTIGDFDNINYLSTYSEMEPIENLIEIQAQVLQTLKNDVESIEKSVNENNFKNQIDSTKYVGSFIAITNTINTILTINHNSFWVKMGIVDLSNRLLGAKTPNEQSQLACDMVAHYLKASVVVIYNYDEKSGILKRGATHSYMPNEETMDHYRLGEGVIGQVAKDRKSVEIFQMSKKHSKIATATTITDPFGVYIYPIVYNDELLGVMELVSQKEFNTTELEYLVEVLDSIGMILYITKKDELTKILLEQTLEQKAELESQSEELQQTNTQLEEQQQELEMQSIDLQTQNNQLEKTQNELIIKKDMLEKAIQYKSEFLANVSHELRTPLNAIILLSKLIKEDGKEKIGEENSKKADIIHKSGNDLLKLINDILNFSKIEANKMEIHPIKFTSKDLVYELEEFFRYTAQEKELEFRVEDRLNGTIYSDYDKLIHVTKNILSNAFKFTSDGFVKLVIGLDSSNDTMVKITIEDSGIGIANDKLDEVFEPFKQLDGAVNRKFAGTGLGLSIAKDMVKLLGGTITVESELDKGSIFTITFPINVEALAELSKIETQKESIAKPQENFEKQPIIIDNTKEMKIEKKEEFANKTILIVDDDARNIFALSALFEHLGAKVLNAFTGAESLEIIKKEKIDLVLMDIMMPEMDGYETIMNIRNNLKLKNLPIIVVTAKAMKDEREKALKSGANDYIAKPVDHNILTKMALQWIDMNEK